MNIVRIPDGKNKLPKLRFINCDDCPIFTVVKMTIGIKTDWMKSLFTHFSNKCWDCKKKEWLEE